LTKQSLGHYLTKQIDNLIQLILSTYFDDNGGAAIFVLLKECWVWWLVQVAEDSVDDYPLVAARHPNGISPLL